MTTDTDRFLAERLMGWHIETRYPSVPGLTYDVWCDEVGPVRHLYEWTPSTCITNALGDGSPQTVVGWMRERGWWLSLYESPANEYGWYAEFRKGKKIVQSFAITPAAAVSSASRKALEGEG